MQLLLRNNFNITKKEYFEIIKKKTATLFSCVARTGATLSGSKFEKELALYGLNLGIAFQIIDDLDDILGDEKVMGKPAGQNIIDGEMTLPIIMLIKKLKNNERKDVIKSLANPNKQNIINIHNILLETDTIQHCKIMAHTYINKAKRNLEKIPDSRYKVCLYGLTVLLEKKIEGYN